MWDLEGALAAGEVPTSWRLASTYRVELIEPGDPVVLWRTRGWTGPAGVVAAGTVIERPDRCELQPGDVDDHRWVSTAARDRPRPRDPVVLWRTRGWTGPAGVVAAGTVIERPDRCELQPGDVDDHRWVSTAARDRPRPRVQVALDVLVRPVEVERTDGVPVLRRLEVRRVPRIGNPSVITPEQWQALEALINR